MGTLGTLAAGEGSRAWGPAARWVGGDPDGVLGSELAACLVLPAAGRHLGETNQHVGRVLLCVSNIKEINENTK